MISSNLAHVQNKIKSTNMNFFILNLAKLIYSFISFIPIIGWTNIFYTWEIPTSTLNKWNWLIIFLFPSYMAVMRPWEYISPLHTLTLLMYQLPLFCEIKGSLSRLQSKSHHQVMEICHFFTKHSYMLWKNQNILYIYNN